jgi:hypothetical protein
MEEIEIQRGAGVDWRQGRRVIGVGAVAGRAVIGSKLGGWMMPCSGLYSFLERDSRSIFRRMSVKGYLGFGRPNFVQLIYVS